jgi:hypothetical protein
MLHDYGIEFTEPSAWHGRFYRVVDPIFGPATLQASTVPFVDADYSSYQMATCATMSANDALLIAMIYDPEAFTAKKAVPTFGSLRDFSFGPADFTQIQGLPSEQIQARAVIKHGGRICELVACFGSSNPSNRLLGAATSAFRTLRVSGSPRKEANGGAVEVRLPQLP